MQLTDAGQRETERAARERAAQERRTADRLNPVLSGAALVHECTRAVETVLARTGRKVSESERLVLTQTIACDALTAHRKQRGTEPMRRSDVGRNYLSALVRGHLKQERGWRDTLDGYRTRGEREHGLLPLIAGSVQSAETDESEREDGAPRSWLNRSLSREREQSAARPLPRIAAEHLRVIAYSLADTLSDECGCTSDSERSKVRAAVLSGCGIPLIRQSETERASVSALKHRSTAGAALIRERIAAPVLSVLVRIALESEHEDSALRRALRTSLSVDAERLVLAAEVLVDETRRDGYRHVQRTANRGSSVTASAEPLSRMSGPQYRAERARVLSPPSVCGTCFKVHPHDYPHLAHPVRSTVQ